MEGISCSALVSSVSIEICIYFYLDICIYVYIYVSYI